MKNPIRNRMGTLIGTTEIRNDGTIELRNRGGTLVGTEDKNGRTCDRNGTLKATGRGSLSALIGGLS
jgi:hypothetical protein